MSLGLIGGLVRLPIFGPVRAGPPVEAVENLEDHIVLDRTLAKSAHFVLRVKGDSMCPEILEGKCSSSAGCRAQSGYNVVA